MPRGKAQKKSSMRGKRGLNNSRATDERDTGKKTAGQAGRRSTTSGARAGQFEEGSPRTRAAAAKGGRASQGGARRQRKSGT